MYVYANEAEVVPNADRYMCTSSQWYSIYVMYVYVYAFVHEVNWKRCVRKFIYEHSVVGNVKQHGHNIDVCNMYEHPVV